MWISNTLYNNFFILVFGCYIYLTLSSLCFSLYIGTAHYSILEFFIFVYPVPLLALLAPGCNITSFR